MGPATAIKTGFAKSFQFSGRATRSEFWWFYAFVVGIEILATNLDIMLFGKSLYEPITTIWPLSDTLIILLSLPIAGVSARRLHDVSLPRWPAILVALLTISAQVTDWGSPTSSSPSLLATLAIGLGLALLIPACFRSSQHFTKLGPNSNEVPS